MAICLFKKASCAIVSKYIRKLSVIKRVIKYGSSWIGNLKRKNEYVVVFDVIKVIVLFIIKAVINVQVIFNAHWTSKLLIVFLFFEYCEKNVNNEYSNPKFVNPINKYNAANNVPEIPYSSFGIK